MLDSTGQNLEVGDTAQLLCEVTAIDEDGVRVRVLNSEQELLISIEPGDEIMAPHVSAELTKLVFVPHPDAVREAQELGLDGLKRGVME